MARSGRPAKAARLRAAEGGVHPGRQHSHRRRNLPCGRRHRCLGPPVIADGPRCSGQRAASDVRHRYGRQRGVGRRLDPPRPATFPLQEGAGRGHQRPARRPAALAPATAGYGTLGVRARASPPAEVSKAVLGRWGRGAIDGQSVYYLRALYYRAGLGRPVRQHRRDQPSSLGEAPDRT